MAQGFSNNSGIALPLAISSGGSGVTSSKPVIQQVYTQTGTMATMTTTVPLDNTKPQNTEGTEVMTLAITPTNSANILVIEVEINNAASTLCSPIAALFQDSTADALKTVAATISAASYMGQLHIVHIMAAGTTSSTTFKARMGPNVAATVTFNGVGGASEFNGTYASYMRITEYAV